MKRQYGLAKLLATLPLLVALAAWAGEAQLRLPSALVLDKAVGAVAATPSDSAGKGSDRKKARPATKEKVPAKSGFPGVDRPLSKMPLPATTTEKKARDAAALRGAEKLRLPRLPSAGSGEKRTTPSDGRGGLPVLPPGGGLLKAAPALKRQESSKSIPGLPNPGAALVGGGKASKEDAPAKGTGSLKLPMPNVSLPVAAEAIGKRPLESNKGSGLPSAAVPGKIQPVYMGEVVFERLELVEGDPLRVEVRLHNSHSQPTSLLEVRLRQEGGGSAYPLGFESLSAGAFSDTRVVWLGRSGGAGETWEGVELDRGECLVADLRYHYEGMRELGRKEVPLCRGRSGPSPGELVDVTDVIAKEFTPVITGIEGGAWSAEKSCVYANRLQPRWPVGGGLRIIGRNFPEGARIRLRAGTLSDLFRGGGETASATVTSWQRDRIDFTAPNRPEWASSAAGVYLDKKLLITLLSSDGRELARKAVTTCPAFYMLDVDVRVPRDNRCMASGDRNEVPRGLRISMSGTEWVGREALSHAEDWEVAEISGDVASYADIDVTRYYQLRVSGLKIPVAHPWVKVRFDCGPGGRDTEKEVSFEGPGNHRKLVRLDMSLNRDASPAERSYGGAFRTDEARITKVEARAKALYVKVENTAEVSELYLEVWQGGRRVAGPARVSGRNYGYEFRYTGMPYERGSGAFVPSGLTEVVLRGVGGSRYDAVPYEFPRVRSVHIYMSNDRITFIESGDDALGGAGEIKQAFIGIRDMRYSEGICASSYWDEPLEVEDGEYMDTLPDESCPQLWERVWVPPDRRVLTAVFWIEEEDDTSANDEWEYTWQVSLSELVRRGWLTEDVERWSGSGGLGGGSELTISVSLFVNFEGFVFE